MSENAAQSSFRDPSGFVFSRDDVIYRQVNLAHKEHWDHLVGSGLYSALVGLGLLIPHTEVDIPAEKPDVAYKVIRPEKIFFISYPYEWCFSQLKDAALTLLRIQKTALDFEMSLRDCSAYNVQFRNGRPVLIDTLSLGRYYAGQPWAPYRQFCQHFVAPLALMSYRDVRLSHLFRAYIDGIPLDLASTLLPRRTYLRPGALYHVHLHARSQRLFAGKDAAHASKGKVSRHSLAALVDSLESAVKGLKWSPSKSEWTGYYDARTYSPDSLNHKRQLVSEMLDRTGAKSAWDFGGNTGLFARIAADKGIPTIGFDADISVVEASYRAARANDGADILPLVCDLTNPSPRIGWQNRERMSLADRGPADVGMALALIHHLAISNNVPFGRIADFFAEVCRFLIVEFVPKDDPQVRRMLSVREDIFPDYDQQAFEAEFAERFSILDSRNINDSQRVLYLMKRR